ncbi:hypothetical protein [Macrococcoides caseolyticum]|nr:hypothetical protein [Macrococcus caseolyticus]ARQ04401.1 hypothetical protein CA207_11500 [Macrococcus caseolyticus]
MLSREDGKHYKKHELDQQDIYELMEHEYRIMNKKEQEQRQKELQELDAW